MAVLRMPADAKEAADIEKTLSTQSTATNTNLSMLSE